MAATTSSPSPGRSCIRCLLPDTMPGLHIDDNQLCDFCREAPDVEALRAERIALRREMERVIDERRGATPYEVVVAYSGGKDSSYTLKLLVEHYRLRCIAITIDNGFLGDGTLDNCRAVCGALGVDHMLFTPSRQFTSAMYRKSAEDDRLHSKAAIKRASAICSSCIAMINTHMLQQALQLGAPVVAGGYIGGQVPRDGAVMMIRAGAQGQRARSAMVERFASHLGEGVRAYFELPQGRENREIAVINPMLGITVTEEQIVAALTPMGWRRPRDTGVTSTNCRLNDLGVFLHTRRHGFHPYALEIAEQVRAGTMSRQEAQAKLQALPRREQVIPLAKGIGLSEDAL
ncbi:MAG: hypothetical protein ACFCBW_17495 [Candidatus Competibacterales bacterium]